MGDILQAKELLLYLQRGGPVMWVLYALALVLWYALGLRFVALRRGSRRSVHELVRAALAGRIPRVRGILDRASVLSVRALAGHPVDPARAMDDATWELRRSMQVAAPVVRTIVLVAPLLGLLGTVSGMIETFESLGRMELHSSTGGVAAGISEALFTTQMGLAVSVPGLVVGRLLDRRQLRLNQEIDQVREELMIRHGAQA
jgi:biopolymer transport protein ExbB